ncbi:hypothetical protein BpHYR1_041274 [Brachionus plicatilis]|uniref:Uncharacterized protein n=1 Tax=Brachionus plicatilis TaxID=10195 RepID=A0A3M7PH96_BRAPC|nr:hypothetical protein BpHYR1_041274 [Brachionus plicatilis]
MNYNMLFFLVQRSIKRINDIPGRSEHGQNKAAKNLDREVGRPKQRRTAKCTAKLKTDGHFGGQIKSAFLIKRNLFLAGQLRGPNFWPPVWPPKWPSTFITVRLGSLVRGLKNFWPHQWPFVRFPTLKKIDKDKKIRSHDSNLII